MGKKYLKPGSLALGENNAKMNIWHGRYNGSYSDVLEQGFFKAYYKMLEAGDLICLVVEDEELDVVLLLVSENSATPEDYTAEEEFIKTKLVVSTKNTVDVKILKQQIKAELARTYGLQKAEVKDGEQDTDN